MKHMGFRKCVDEERLENDLGYRFSYLTEFMGFSESDIQTIHQASVLLGPRVPSLVDAVYEKLNSYDTTWRYFLPRQHGSEGEVPGSLDEFSMDHPQIVFRRQHLARFLERLVTTPYDGQMVEYLDMVGKIHTAKAGNAEIDIPLVQMNALMGFVADAINATILGTDLPPDAKAAAIRSFGKLLWLQNDLINRHYGGLRRTA